MFQNTLNSVTNALIMAINYKLSIYGLSFLYHYITFLLFNNK